MSEMVANKGIIKEIFPEKETLREKVQALADSLGIRLAELVNERGLEDNEADFNSNYWNNYTEIGGRLYDTTNCPDLYDYESEHDDTMQKIGPHEYKVDFYYYNGGTCMEEVFSDLLGEADKAYENSPNVEEELDEIMEDLIVGHNFEYARKALLEWHNKHKG